MSCDFGALREGNGAGTLGSSPSESFPSDGAPALVDIAPTVVARQVAMQIARGTGCLGFAAFGMGGGVSYRPACGSSLLTPL